MRPFEAHGTSLITILTIHCLVMPTSRVLRRLARAIITKKWNTSNSIKHLNNCIPLFECHCQPRTLLAGIHHTLNFAAVCRFDKLLNRTRCSFNRHSGERSNPPQHLLPDKTPGIHRFLWTTETPYPQKSAFIRGSPNAPFTHLPKNS